MTQPSRPVFPPATPLQPRKRAILVGASSGIGAALARQLAKEGYSLALLARRGELLEELCAQINREAGETRALPYAHDVTGYDTVPALLQKIVQDLGGLDLFIYNSGVSHMAGLKNYDFEKDRLTTEVNYLGALAWLNPVAAMFQSAKSGQIVGMSSVAGDRGRVGNPSYNASKAALTSYLEALRNRLSRYGVNVLTLKPGYVETDLLKGAKKLFWVVPAEAAARDMVNAIRKRKQTVYVPARWRWLMLVIIHIPSVIFRRLTF
ncbi:MAG: SDR family NAD(P)-dependent oxidoreductase [Chloroflexota bacterium]